MPTREDELMAILDSFETEAERNAFLDELQKAEGAAMAAPAEKGWRQKLGEEIANRLPESVKPPLASLAEKFGMSRDLPFEENYRQGAETLMDIPIPGQGGFKSYNERLEQLPMLGGVLGALGGGAPAVGGAIAGEAVRQGTRKAIGVPAAPGFWQETLDVDPDSMEASALGLGVEGATASAGSVLSKLMGKAAPSLIRSSRRSIANVLKAKDKLLHSKGEQIVERVLDEGIARPGRSRRAMAGIADTLKSDAEADVARILGELGDDARLPPEATSRVTEALAENINKLRGGRGGDPKTASSFIKKYKQVMDEFNELVGEGGDISLKDAVTEKQRLDSLLSEVWESGRKAPKSKKALQVGANAIRDAIRAEFEDLGNATIRQSDLITISKLLNDAVTASEWAGTAGTRAGAAAGAAAGGRWSIPLMTLGSRIGETLTSGPASSLSAGGKRLLARVMSSPGAMQAFVRILDNINTSSSPENDSLEME